MLIFVYVIVLNFKRFVVLPPVGSKIGPEKAEKLTTYMWLLDKNDFFSVTI